MPPAGEPNADFQDLLRAFVEHDVRFLVVGAHAVAAHGIPRATQDLDVWIDRGSENAGTAEADGQVNCFDCAADEGRGCGKRN
jgi:hypothetical protein